MPNIIGFLEEAGSNAAMRYATREQLLQMMEWAEIAPTAVDSLVGAREAMYCSNELVPSPQRRVVKNVLDSLLVARQTMYCSNEFVPSPRRREPVKAR